MQVLIVEDDPNNQAVVSSELEKMAGVEVVQAVTLEEALAAARGRFDLVFLDVVMPEDDDAGIHIANKFRETNPNAFLALMTGLDRDDLAVQVIESGGADAYIQKPVFLENVRTVLDQAWAKKKQVEQKPGRFSRILKRFGR